eukprot:15447378-Alexandrium_andersonii.AAC.1
MGRGSSPTRLSPNLSHDGARAVLCCAELGMARALSGVSCAWGVEIAPGWDNNDDHTPRING